MAQDGIIDPTLRGRTGRRRCPICGKPASPEHRPFCSGRCADIDLGRWFKGSYSVPADEPPDEEPDPEEA